MASSSCRSVALFLRMATILRSALTSKPVALASRYLSRMSPVSAFFSSSRRSICSTNWRSCFCAETCSVVMDPPSDGPVTSAREWPIRRHCTGVPSPPPDESATLAVRHCACKALRLAIQRFWPKVLARGFWPGGFGRGFWPGVLVRGFGQEILVSDSGRRFGSSDLGRRVAGFGRPGWRGAGNFAMVAPRFGAGPWRVALNTERVACHIVRLPADEPLADGKTVPGATRDIVVAKILTTDGIEGVGVAFFGAAMTGALKVAVDELGALAVGSNPHHVEHIADKLRQAAGTSGPGGLFTLALSAIDTALWDIRGKALGLPLASLLGG